MKLKVLTFKLIMVALVLILPSRMSAQGNATLGDSIAEPVGNFIEMENEDIVSIALKYVGARYRLGHTGPHTFDCSGFTSYVYKQRHIDLTRTSRTQYQEGRPVERLEDLQPGDLVFFGGRNSIRTVGHVGIVTEVSADGDDFRFVHASRTGVKEDALSTYYYKKRYLGARRVF